MTQWLNRTLHVCYSYRLSDIHDFIFNYHPLAKSDDNLASLSAVSQATLTDSNRLEIVNIHGQYADDVRNCYIGIC
jgi:hypothetical protein